MFRLRSINTATIHIPRFDIRNIHSNNSNHCKDKWEQTQANQTNTHKPTFGQMCLHKYTTSSLVYSCVLARRKIKKRTENKHTNTHEEEWFCLLFFIFDPFLSQWTNNKNDQTWVNAKLHHYSWYNLRWLLFVCDARRGGDGWMTRGAHTGHTTNNNTQNYQQSITETSGTNIDCILPMLSVTYSAPTHAHAHTQRDTTKNTMSCRNRTEHNWKKR